jgi:hypothetical protein
MPGSSDTPDDILAAYEAGHLPLDEAARRLAVIPEHLFRSDSLNCERGMATEWVDRILTLCAAVQRLRNKRSTPGVS